MAHNAFLREALGKLYGLTTCGALSNALANYVPKEHRLPQLQLATEALNATGPDVEAWKETIEMESFKRGAASAITAHYEQLATVTAERDALLECCKKKVETPFHSYDDFTRGEVACAESILDLSEALAQKCGE